MGRANGFTPETAYASDDYVAVQALVAAERDLICRTLHSQTSIRADAGAPGVLLPLGAERG